MGQLQVNITSLEGARSAAKSVITNSHDTQQGGVTQVLNRQHLTNGRVPDSASSNAHSDGTIMSGKFQQCKTGKKVY